MPVYSQQDAIRTKTLGEANAWHHPQTSSKPKPCEEIDEKRLQAGWNIQDKKQMNLMAGEFGVHGVARATGLSRATITLLYKETAQKVDLEAIEKLCLLFKCQVGDLLELTQQ